MPAWLTTLPGVVAVRPGAGFAELELGPDTEPADVLAAAVALQAPISRFEVAEPSLEAIFIETVGRSADDDPTLADDAASSGLSVVEGAA